MITRLATGMLGGAGVTFSLPGHLPIWSAARAAAGSQRAKIVVIGDSVGVGWNATNRGTQGWVPLLRGALQASYGVGGGGSLGITDELGAYWLHAGETTWTRVGFANADGFGLYLFSAKGTVGDYMTRSWSGRYLAVHWKGSTSNSANFTVSINGGAAQAVNGAANNNYNVSEFDAGSDGTHTVRIDAPSTASKYAWITGCIPYKTLDGVSVINASYSGRRIDNYVSGAFGTALDELATIGPDLVIYSLTINDYNTQYSLANYSTRLDTAIVKAQAAGADVMLVVNNDIQAIQAIPYAAYRDTVLSKAKKNRAAYLSFYDYWKRYAAANAAGWMGDGTHPSTAGQAFMAEKAGELIG